MADATPTIDQVQNVATDFASTAATNAQAVVTDASGFLGSLTDAASFHAGSLGNYGANTFSMYIPGISAAAPGRPDIGTLGGISAQIDGCYATRTYDCSSFPTITENTIPPITITMPTAPTFVSEVTPTEPTINAVALPTAPTETVPDKLTSGSIGGYTIPAVPSVSIPTFAETIPAFTMTVPNLNFAYVEPAFSSALKDAIDAKLLLDVQNGGTGLSAAVEDAIWLRTRDRDDRAYQEASDKLDSLWAGKGFDLPSGVLVQEHQDLINRDTDMQTERNRDITIKQAELAQENTHFFNKTGLTSVQLDMNQANEVNNRALEAAKATMEFGIAFQNLKINDYNIQLERYKLQVVQHSAYLDAEKLKLEAHKAELMNIELNSSLDKDLLSQYNLDLQRYDRQLALYEVEQKAAVTSMTIEKMKVDIYSAQIGAYKAKIETQAVQADVYLAQVKGELGKVDVFTAQLKAEEVRVGTLETMVNIEIAKIKESISLNELELRAYLGRIEKYKAESGMSIAEMQMKATMYGHDIDKYRADIQKDVAQLQLGVESMIKHQAIDVQNARIRLEAAKAELSASIGAANVRVAAAKGLGTAFAGMAAAVGSGLVAISSVESAALTSVNTELTAAAE